MALPVAGSIPVTWAGRRAGPRRAEVPRSARVVNKNDNAPRIALHVRVELDAAPLLPNVHLAPGRVHRLPFFGAVEGFAVLVFFGAVEGFALVFVVALLGGFAALVFFGVVEGFTAARLGFASGSAFGAVSAFGEAGGSAISVVALVTGAAAAELGAGALGATGAGRGAVESSSRCGPWCAMFSRSRHRSTIPRRTAASVSCTPVCRTCSCCRRWYS